MKIQNTYAAIVAISCVNFVSIKIDSSDDAGWLKSYGKNITKLE